MTMLVIGLGSEFRRDDALGLVAARRLRERGIPAEEHEGDLAALMDRWKGTDGVALIDAVCSGAPPGTLYCLDVSATPLDAEIFKSSTHALGLAEAVELSRTFGTLPPRAYVFGVEASDVSAGVGLSPQVESALPALLENVLMCMKHR